MISFCNKTQRARRLTDTFLASCVQNISSGAFAAERTIGVDTITALTSVRHEQALVNVPSRITAARAPWTQTFEPIWNKQFKKKNDISQERLKVKTSPLFHLNYFLPESSRGHCSQSRPQAFPIEQQHSFTVMGSVLGCEHTPKNILNVNHL